METQEQGSWLGVYAHAVHLAALLRGAATHAARTAQHAVAAVPRRAGMPASECTLSAAARHLQAGRQLLDVRSSVSVDPTRTGLAPPGHLGAGAGCLCVCDHAAGFFYSSTYYRPLERILSCQLGYRGTTHAAALT